MGEHRSYRPANRTDGADAQRRKTDDVLTVETTPDFDALRAKRTASVNAVLQKLADECGVPVENLHSNYNPNACYCACVAGGSCEHKWDGEPWESPDECCWSATCSRCGCTALSHDMRVLP